jgi:hypothetical protein
MKLRNYIFEKTMKKHEQKNKTVWEWEESPELKKFIEKQQKTKTNESSK